jgi:hypothetical protein
VPSPAASPGGPAHLAGAASAMPAPGTETMPIPTVLPTTVPTLPYPATPAPPEPAVERAFLRVLPRVAAVARFTLCHFRCPETRADRVAEAVGLCWKKFALLSARGEDPGTFATTLALRWRAFHAGAGG